MVLAGLQVVFILLSDQHGSCFYFFSLLALVEELGETKETRVIFALSDLETSKRFGRSMENKSFFFLIHLH